MSASAVDDRSRSADPEESASVADASDDRLPAVGLDALRQAGGVPEPAARLVDALVRRWPALRRWADRRGLVAAAAMVLALGVGGAWLVRGEDGARPAPVLPMASRHGGASAAGAGARPAPASAPEGQLAGTALRGTDAPAWAAVAGAVARPGLYPVDAATRVSALIAAAGGFTVDADPDRVNLAAVVRDGERVWVPRRGDTEAPAVIAGGANGGGASPGSAGRGGAPSGPVNLNTASAEELDRLPGVGPATAAAIIEHRTASGPFSSVEDLAAVRGIGPAKLEQLRPLVTV